MTRRRWRINLRVAGALFAAVAMTAAYAPHSDRIGQGLVDAVVMLFLVFAFFQVLTPAVFTALRDRGATAEMRENIEDLPLSKHFFIDRDP